MKKQQKDEVVIVDKLISLVYNDAEDSLMKACSKDIAAELLEMTFGSEVKMQEW